VETLTVTGAVWTSYDMVWTRRPPVGTVLTPQSRTRATGKARQSDPLRRPTEPGVVVLSRSDRPTRSYGRAFSARACDSLDAFGARPTQTRHLSTIDPCLGQIAT
jgi:hypothetical protein